MTVPLSVSVIIPTVGRPSVRAAVESVLQQTVPPAEVVVVLDRDCVPDLPESPTVKVVRTSGGVGPSLAKQTGIEASTGTVIALLDDDDTWRPDKLEKQLAAVPPDDAWVVACRFCRHLAGRPPVEGPKTLITPHESVAAYLFEHRAPQAFHMVQTSTLMFPRALVDAVPMSIAAGAVHDDPTWMIELRRAFPQMPIIQLGDTLVDIVWTEVSVSRPGVDRSRELIEWGLKELADESPRVRGDYMLTSAVGSALGAGSLGGVLRSIAAGARHGRPGKLAWASAVKSLLRLGAGRARALRAKAR